MDFILNFKDFTVEYRNQHSLVEEAEHQVGRYLNMQKIIAEIKQTGLKGDVVEFGTWQGLGLVILHRLFDNKEMKFIGIDSFEGLPVDSNFWRKGMFNNTSLNYTIDNLKKYTGTTEQFHLIKGWFSDSIVKESLYKTTNDVALVHLDADLGVSTTQALDVIRPYLVNRKKPIYFLFDDWGLHPDEVPDAFLNWANREARLLGFEAVKLSSTRCTRYYRLDFNE